MEYKILVVEDNPDTYDLYTRNIEGVCREGFVNVSLVNTKPTSQMTHPEFQEVIKSSQPDIVFLDYDLEWRTESGGVFKENAREVVRDLHNKLVAGKFPPIIVLNTAKPERHQAIYEILNLGMKKTIISRWMSDTSQIDVPKSFVKILSPASIESNHSDLLEVIREGIELLQEDRGAQDIWNSQATFYIYPNTPELINQHGVLNLSDQQGYDLWFKSKGGHIDPVIVGKRNFVSLSLYTNLGPAKKDRIGLLITLNGNGEPNPSLFTFQTKGEIEKSLHDALGGHVATFDGNFRFNPKYFKKERSRLTCTNATLIKSLSSFVRGELDQLNISIEHHPVLKSLAHIDGIS